MFTFFSMKLKGENRESRLCTGFAGLEFFYNKTPPHSLVLLTFNPAR